MPIPSQDSKMLIEKYDVSYAYAAHLLMAQKNNSFQNANKSIATFAPQYQVQNHTLLLPLELDQEKIYRIYPEQKEKLS